MLNKLWWYKRKLPDEADQPLATNTIRKLADRIVRKLLINTINMTKLNMTHTIYRSL